MPNVTDLLNNLRLRNIFRSPTPDENMGIPNTWTGQGSPNPNPYIMSLGEKQDPFLPEGNMFQPVDTGPAKPIQPQQDEAMRRFMISLGEMPTREQGKPSNWRKLGAGIVGAGQGMDQGHKFLTHPYDEKIDDWKLKTATQGRAAELERLNNSQISRDEYNDMMIKWRNDDLDRKEKEGQQRIGIAEGNADTARRRADSYIALNDYKMKNPDWDIIKVEGGNYMLIDPKTGTSKDTGIKTGTMTTMDEINLRIKGQKEVAAIPRTVNTSGTTTTIGPPEANIPNPNEQKVGEYLRARELANDPQLQPYIVLGDPSTNDFQIKPETPPEIQKVIKDRIYPRGDVELPNPQGNARTTTRSSTSVSTRGSVPSAPVKRTGTARVRRTSDGQTGTWDFSKGPIPSGFEEVK